MIDTRYQRLSELLLAGFDLPADQRREKLEALDDDPLLVAEALQLLELEQDDFLAVSPVRRLEQLNPEQQLPSGSTAAEQEPTSGEVPWRPSGSEPSNPAGSEASPHFVGRGLPEQVGPFRILGRLGEGGMGVVYLAEQTEPVRRRVALKMLREGFAGRVLRARFEAERHAVARLHHPNVAQLFEAGSTAEGQPYFAMELIEGRPLTTYCDVERLSIRERIDLFRSVCEGVQHAHQRGLLHRDLKPANILVAKDDSGAVPKILDFGIAKAIDRPLIDGTLWTGDHVIGTPAYLSPEAVGAAGAGLDLDTRSDVYALGIVLYELLVGVRPLDLEGLPLVETLRWVAEKSPPAPSARWAALEPEICGRLAELRQVEPGTLDRLLQGDLDWILQKAIARDRADRYPSVEHLSADLERHLHDEPVEAGPPSTFYRLKKFVRRRRGVVAAGGLVFASLILGLTGTLVNLERANQEAAAARQALEEAEEISGFLENLFEVSDPGEARGSEVTARELLDRGAEEILGGFEDRPLVKARFLVTIGRVFQKLGLYDRSRPLLEEAVAIRRSEPSASPAELATAFAELGSVLLERGAYDEAEPILREALEAREKALSPDDPTLATDLDHLARLAFHQGSYDESETLYGRAIDLRTRAFGPDDRSLASSLGSLGILYWYQGRFDEAEPLLRRTLEIAETHLGPDHPEVGKHLNNLGGLYGTMGRMEDSERLFRRSLEVAEKTLGPDHPTLAQAINNLALILQETGRYADAEPLYRRALAIREQALGPVNSEVAVSLTNLGSLYEAQGQFDEAVAYLRRALSIREQTVGADHPDLGKSLVDLGTALVKAGQGKEGEAKLRAGYEILAARLAPDHVWVRSALQELVALYRQTGAHAEADALEGRPSPPAPGE